MDLNSACFLAADANSDRIGNPLEYPFDKDSDGDGIKDANSWGGMKIYNGATKRHADGMNFLFADSSVRWVALTDFLGNKNRIWNRR
jgi:prepilin-type processing-associated H-X9-DG protein